MSNKMVQMYYLKYYQLAKTFSLKCSLNDRINI